MVVFAVKVGGSVTLMKALRNGVDVCRASFGGAVSNPSERHLSTGGQPAEDKINLIGQRVNRRQTGARSRARWAVATYGFNETSW